MSVSKKAFAAKSTEDASFDARNDAFNSAVKVFAGAAMAAEKLSSSFVEVCGDGRRCGE